MAANAAQGLLAAIEAEDSPGPFAEGQVPAVEVGAVTVAVYV